MSVNPNGQNNGMNPHRCISNTQMQSLMQPAPMQNNTMFSASSGMDMFGSANALGSVSQVSSGSDLSGMISNSMLGFMANISMMMTQVMMLANQALMSLVQSGTQGNTDNTGSSFFSPVSESSVESESSASSDNVNLSTQNGDSPSAATSSTPQGQAAVSLADSLIGLNENSNTAEIQKITKTNPTKMPWCMFFVSGILEKTGGAPWSDELGHAGHVQTVKRWAEKKGLFRDKNSGYIPKAGDVFTMTRGGGDKGHTGIVESVIYEGGKAVGVVTIEGNTSNKVQRKERKFSASSFQGFIEV